MSAKKISFYTLASGVALSLLFLTHNWYPVQPIRNKLAAIFAANQTMTPPNFIIGVWYQPKENFQLWKDRGINTLVGYESNTNTSRAQWIAAARAAGLFYIIRPDGTSADFQAGTQDPNLLAWEQFPDEPDGAGNTLAAAMSANYTQWKSQSTKPVFINLDGARFQYSQQSDYQGYIQGGDWIGLDYYIINRGEGPENISKLGDAIDRLKSWIAAGGVNKKIYVFIESSDQNLKASGYFLNGRGPTASEMNQEISIATSHGASGIMYFPDIIGRNFEAYDGTPADVAADMTATNAALAAQNQQNIPPSAAGPVIANVTASGPDINSAYVRWTTDAPSDAQVVFGQTPSYGSSTVTDTNLQTYHTETLANLTPNTTYHYSVKSQANGVLSVSGDYTFTTLQNPATVSTAPTSNPIVASAGGGSSNSGESGGGGGSSYSAHATAVPLSTAVPQAKPAAVSVVSVRNAFTKNLNVGISDPQVKILQQFLNGHGFTISASGPGSPGNETIKFGAATKAALIKFQKAHKITPATGNLGPLTRKTISAL